MIEDAIELIKNSKYLTVSTGAGISVESGIPPFRGKDGVWNKFDPELLNIEYFIDNPKKSWEFSKKVFFDTIGNAKPNSAHFALAKLEKLGILKTIITQNIDNLHFKAGSKNLVEFHGNIRDLVCLDCLTKQRVAETELDILPPKCKKCGGILKPDFVFFGEEIPENALEKAIEAVEKTDVMLVIGTTGNVVPASQLPINASQQGAKIIEINIEPTVMTDQITDIFLQGKASEILSKIIADL